MFTIEQKDKILSLLIEQNSFNLVLSTSDIVGEVSNITTEAVILILKQFHKMELLNYSERGKGQVHLELHAEIFDFYNRGGFKIQEELLIDSIKKLKLELEKLQNDLPERVATISSIIAYISTVYSFLSK